MCVCCALQLDILRPDGSVEYELRQPGCNTGGVCASQHCYLYSCYFDGTP